MIQIRISKFEFRIDLAAISVVALVLALVAGGLFAGPFIAEAQQARKFPVIGVLVTNAAPQSTSLLAFVQGLLDPGYIDGKNIAIEIRSASGNPDALPGLAAELVQLRVDVLYAIGPASVSAARNATPLAPIVALDLETDPVQAGWVRSLARPGGNLTGLFLNLPGLTGKWLELLRQAAPRIRRVGLLWDSTTGSFQLDAAKAAAPKFAMDLQVMEVRRSDDFDAVLRAGVSAGSRAIVLLSSPTVNVKSQLIADFALKNRLPAISPFRSFADAGGLMAYGLNLQEFYRRSAAYADKILKGAQPGDLPIEQPTKFELAVNLKTAKALGLAIPKPILVLADEVIR